jgi:hypothetical protein
MDDAIKEAVEEHIEETIEEQIEEKVEEHIEKQIELAGKPPVLKRLQTTIMMVAALMISAGQWNDTKDIALTVYESTLANFTNQLEYDTISKIHIGNSIDYITNIVGQPHVIKRSKINTAVQFYYYGKDKYHLTLMASDGRLVGYSIYPQQQDFSPNIPFAEQLGSEKLSAANNQTALYSFDIGNLLYYIEYQDLGKEQMFLTLVRGYVEYGAISQSSNVNTDYAKTMKTLIGDLDQQATFSESDKDLAVSVKKLRDAIYPNFYAITELNATLISEALLTRYEYKMFTKS